VPRRGGSQKELQTPFYYVKTIIPNSKQNDTTFVVGGSNPTRNAVRGVWTTSMSWLGELVDVVHALLNLALKNEIMGFETCEEKWRVVEIE